MLCEALGYRDFNQGNLVVLKSYNRREQTDVERDRGIIPERYTITEYGIVTKISPWHIPEGSNYVVMAYYGNKNEQVGAGNWQEEFRKATIFERLFLKHKFPDKSALEELL